jgi:hypothetical protein
MLMAQNGLNIGSATESELQEAATRKFFVIVFADAFVKVRLGDVRLKSWFEERTFASAMLSGVLPGEIQAGDVSRKPVQSELPRSPSFKTSKISNAKPTESRNHKKDPDPNDWWRCLSVSIVNMGFGTSCCKGDIKGFASMLFSANRSGKTPQWSLEAAYCR